MIFFYEFGIYYEPELNKDGVEFLPRLPTLLNFTSAETPQPDAPQYGNAWGGGVNQGTYTSAATVGGITHSAISENTEKTANTLALTVLRTFPIADMFKAGTPPCSIYLRVHVKDAGTEKLCIYSGRVRSVEFNDLTATINCQAILDVLQRPGLTPRFSRSCPYALYDAKTCMASKNAFRWADLPVEAVSEDGLTVTCSLLASKPDGYYTNGLAEFGENPHSVHQVPQNRRMVLSHAGDTIVLMTAIPGLQAGSVFTIYKGCDRTFESCKTFNNAGNFGGFPYIPIKNIYKNGLK